MSTLSACYMSSAFRQKHKLIYLFYANHRIYTHHLAFDVESSVGQKAKQKSRSVFLQNVSRLLFVCVYMLKCRPMPLNCHGGRQDISAPSYFQNAHTHTQSHTQENCPLQAHSPFYQQCADRGHVKQWDSVPVFNHRQETRNKDTEGQTGISCGSLTDLMRGTLSSVQHKVGPVCEYSSSSHDWLYNLEHQTCMHTHTHTNKVV